MKSPRPTHPKLKGPVTWTYFYLYVILDLPTGRQASSAAMWLAG